jgi:hypothetical protein
MKTQGNDPPHEARGAKLTSAAGICEALNWGIYDPPQAMDVSKLTRLFTVDGKEKARGRTFRHVAERFRANPPAYALPNRPDLPWAPRTASGDEMENFRQAYLAAFAER